MKLFYTYDEFESDARTLAKSLKNEGFDAIIGVARGGFFLAARLAYLLGIRQLHSVSVTQYKGSEQGSVNICSLPKLTGAKKVLVCDDICDSGACLSALMSELKGSFQCEFGSATLFYKSTAIFKPDFYAKQALGWIVFPWEVDALGEEF